MRYIMLGSLLCLLFLLPRGGIAQLSKADSSALGSSVAALRERYAGTLRADSRLLTGTEYIDYTKPRTKGHQFLLAPTPQTGSLVYQDIAYSNVPLLYDIKQDEVVLADTGGVTNIKLLANHIEQFKLADRWFIRLTPDSANRQLMPIGFYELLVDGPTSMLARRTKKLVDESSLQKVSYRYQEENRLFVVKDDAITEVTNLKSILKLLPDKKAELTKFARTTKLQFKKDTREMAAVALVRYYNTLTPN